jgi:Activator of Hsp90 ATPase homolog 1-like protein
MTMQAVSVEPVRRSVTVGRSVEEAFALFTDGISTWWPFASHSIGGDETTSAVFEPREGGRVYERLANGAEHDWADIVTWDPPRGFVLAWHVNPERRTEVEVRFLATEGGTRVELEHRGWERLSEDVAAKSRENYSVGWEFVLGKYESAA